VIIVDIVAIVIVGEIVSIDVGVGVGIVVVVEVEVC
jgi:hypothetical protein